MQIQEIVSLVTEKTGVSSAILFTKTKKDEIVNARHMVAYIARKYGHSVSGIARSFAENGYECIHTNIVYAVKRGSHKYKTIPYFKSIVKSITND